MQFNAFKTISAVILLNTTVCLAMQRNGGSDPFKIKISSVSCEDRVYNKLQISGGIIDGMQTLHEMNTLRKDLSEMRYKPKPTELMPSNEEFYVSKLQNLRRNQPVDLVVYSNSGRFAKVVTLRGVGEESFYTDCVPLQNKQSPERRPSSMRSPEKPRLEIESPKRLQSMVGRRWQDSGSDDPFDITITSVSCEDRVYRKPDISMAINLGLRTLQLMRQRNMDTNLIQYNPLPTEAMPSQDKFYFSELNNKPIRPADLVIFSSSGKFVKVVALKGDGKGPFYTDCVSLQHEHSSGRRPSRIGSPERRQPSIVPFELRPVRKGSPERV